MLKRQAGILFGILATFSVCQALGVDTGRIEEIKFYNFHAISPRMTTAICQENLKPVVFDNKNTDLTAAGVIHLSNIQMKKQMTPGGLVIVQGTADETIPGPKGKDFKATAEFASVGTKHGHHFYGAYTDGWCGGNYILTVKS